MRSGRQAAHRRIRLATLLAVAVVSAAAGVVICRAAISLHGRTAPAATGWAADVPYERTDGLHYTIVDENGEVVLQTGLFVTVGDEYVSEDNRHYRVIGVQGDRAYAVLLGEFSLDVQEEEELTALSGSVAAQAKPSAAVVGVYHTHGDEGYVRGDGASSTPGRGGVFDVGSALVASSQSQGLTVKHASNAAHGPHDSGAYLRSRRTATSLIRGGAATLLDVHRDSAPRSAYAAEVGGETVSKVMLVVGRANPQMQTTLNFARNYKKVLDEEYPGLSRGIYFGRGSYNQDLTPQALLLEIGSHRTPKEHAVRTAELIGAALPKILGVAGSPGGGGSQTSWANLGWILLVVGIGVGVYMVVASGGWRQALDKLGGFVQREFASALAPRRTAGDGRPRDRRSTGKGSPQGGDDGREPEPGAG